MILILLFFTCVSGAQHKIGIESEKNKLFKHHAFIETQEEFNILKSETDETLYIVDQTEDGYVFNTDSYIKISKDWYVEIQADNFKSSLELLINDSSSDELKNQNDNLRAVIALIFWIPFLYENPKSRYMFAIVILLTRSAEDLLMYSILALCLWGLCAIILLISASITGIFLSCFYKQDDIMELLNKV
jgi:hypothetical protein